MSPEHQKLISDFVLAIISGAVAGWIAGRVLMRRQLDSELTSVDVSRILEMLHSLEEAESNLVSAFFNDAYATQEQKDTGESGRKVVESTYGAQHVISKIASQAEYLRADKYKLLRAYLVLRIRRGRLAEVDEEAPMMEALQQLMEDIYQYVSKRRPSVFERVRSWFKTRLTYEQKKMLANATVQDEPKHWRGLMGDASLKEFDDKDSAKCAAAAEDLVKRGLFLKETEKYSLTREGWKTAVKLTKGRYDYKAGYLIT